MVDLLLFLFVRYALAQDQWRLVHEDGSVESHRGAPQIVADRQAHLRTAWVWSELHAPRRVEVKSIGQQCFEDERLADEKGRLEIRIVPKDGTRIAAGRG